MIPYDLFDREVVEKEALAAKKLESIYHKAQKNIWNGKDVLAELIQKHDGINLEPDKAKAISSIFATILWGEYAAWKISAELALEIEEMEPKLAATSQAHDESRHFYVMHDYLDHLKLDPGMLPKPTAKLLEKILRADSLAKKLLGMQLLVEPSALTLFKMVRESRVDPVLSDLLIFYEKDEARHVALGVKYLPSLIKKMSYSEVIDTLFWQVGLMMLEVDSLKEMEDDFAVLGLKADDVFNMAEAKQLEALKLLGEEIGLKEEFWEPIRKLINIKKDLVFNYNNHKGKLIISTINKLFDFGI